MRLLKVTILGSVILAGIVLVLELAFRLGGLTIGEPLPAPDGSAVVLCVGDSHTLGRRDPDNYPFELERILNARSGGRYRVINAGVGGMNTAQIRARFDRFLDYYRPAVVLHWAGINNYWNLAERGARRTGLVAALVEHSRVVHLVRVALFYHRLRRETLDRPSSHVVGFLGPQAHARLKFAEREETIAWERGENLSLEQIAAVTRADLTAMMAAARGRGIPMLLLAYASWDGYWRPVNEAVLAVSAASGVSYVDTGLAAAAAEREAPGAQLFDNWAHPTPIVYRQIAEEVYRTLVTQGLVAPRS
jgi:hypothetical protein